MQITNSNIIKDGEKKFVDSIADSLDWDTIKKLLVEKYQVEITGDPDYRTGEMSITDSNIGYKFDFDVKILLQLSISCDRDGNCIKITHRSDCRNIDDDTPANKFDEEKDFLNSDTDHIEKRIIRTDNPVNEESFDSKKLKTEVVNGTAVKQNGNISDMACQIATMIDEING